MTDNLIRVQTYTHAPPPRPRRTCPVTNLILSSVPKVVRLLRAKVGYSWRAPKLKAILNLFESLVQPSLETLDYYTAQSNDHGCKRSVYHFACLLKEKFIVSRPPAQIGSF